jgi:hypothetical protein
MPALTKEEWQHVRARYEAGIATNQLHNEHGVSRQAIEQRAKRESWHRDARGEVQTLTLAKVAGLASLQGSKPISRQDAIEMEAERRAQKITAHREEWDELEPLRRAAIEERDLDLANTAYVAIRSLAIKQQQERKAWGIDFLKDAEQGKAPEGEERERVIKGMLDAIDSIARKRGLIA